MIDRQSLTVFLVILGIILLAGVFCFTQLEIVPVTRWQNPAREVRANSFYALEKWLIELGRPVRTLSAGNLDTILSGPEKIIFIETSRFTWNQNPALLIPWLEKGNRLIISLDNGININYRLRDFMKSLGIITVSSYDDDDETNTLLIFEEKEEENISSDTKIERTPSFDWSISFKKTEPDVPLEFKTLIMNNKEKIKLVKLEIGKGSLFITGKAIFLNNYSLRESQNVNLASDIFQTDLPDNREGILFIKYLRGKQNLFGNLAERGNPAALIASLVLLVITGFWMAVPLFGRYRPLPEKPGKPLRERFLAEGRFLKKNQALGKYIETYEKDLEQRKRIKGGFTLAATGNNSPASNAAEELKEITFIQFINEQKKLMEQLEKESL